MSLTEAEEVHAGLHESGANDLLTAFLTARPRLLNYRSSPLVPGPPAAASAWTTIPPLPFPGVPGGIHWGVQFDLPEIDFHPDTAGLPPPLTLGAQRFALRTTVTLTILCGTRRREDPEQPSSAVTPLRAQLKLFGVGHANAVYFGTPGQGEITFDVDAIEIVDIEPVQLEAVLECLIRTLLDAALGNVRLPLEAVTAGAFAFALVRGPEIEDDQLKLYGNVL
jgi:hypothetical protein